MVGGKLAGGGCIVVGFGERGGIVLDQLKSSLTQIKLKMGLKADIRNCSSKILTIPGS